jgi:crossover junction endodeoxyribonuclease RusA
MADREPFGADEQWAEETGTPTNTVYEVDVPLRRGKPPLTSNQRIHHMDRSTRTLEVRHAVMTAARAAKIPAGRHLVVVLHYAPGDRRRRDADNLVPTLKAACDALARGPRRDWVGLELVPDDTPEYMTKHMPVIHPGPGKRRLWITVEVQQ